MRKVMTFLFLFVLCGCTRLGQPQEKIEEEIDETESVVTCLGDQKKTVTFFSKGDCLYAMQYVFYQSIDDYVDSLDLEGFISQEDIVKRINDALSEKYKDIAGVSAVGEVQEKDIQYTLMIDFDVADFDQLVEKGLLNSGEIESQYISLKKTKEAYQAQGYVCQVQ
ncbi:MAG: DUF1307 domain-containing protein [Floccifex sp.]